MAIQVSSDDSNPQDPKLVLTINNGDLRALRDVMSQTRFLNEEALLRYMLVALLRAEDNRLYVRQNGAIVGLVPENNQIRPPEQ